MFTFGARNFLEAHMVRKTGASKWGRFMVPFSGAYVVGLIAAVY